ncbi:FMN-dependent NADH-azoreductase [Pseudoroseicyclus sp. H15]
MQILHIDSSIQGEASVSRQISAAAAQALVRGNRNAELVYRDLATSPIDHLTLGSFADPQASEILEEFLSADVVVLGVGFYNFTIPSQLKAWFDRILMPGQTFKYDDEGRQVGLVPDKKLLVALSRGGLYAQGAPLAHTEHAETLIGWFAQYMGITDVEFIIAEGVRMSDEARDAALSEALLQADALSLANA